MTTDLRTRIAAVADNYFTIMRDREGYIVDGVTGGELADAVIRELGLEIERGGTYEVGGEATSYRYVSDWISQVNDRG